jgi:integrase
MPHPPRQPRPLIRSDDDVRNAAPGRALVAWDEPGYITGSLYLITRLDHLQRRRQRWLWRYSRPNGGGVSEAGIGHMPLVKLAQAKAAVIDHCFWLRQGKAPREAKHVSKNQARTFAAVADEWIAKRKIRWRGESSLRNANLLFHVHGKPLSDVSIAHVTSDKIEEALTPLWTTHPDQARRALAFWESMFDFAQAKGYDIPRLNPARWKSNFEYRFPDRPRSERKNHPSMPYAEVPSFIRELRQRQGTGPVALEFCILTACRSGEVLGMRWEEVEPLEQRVWTIPASRMKAARQHRVPLSDRALELLRRQKERASPPVPYVFTGRSQSSLAAGAMNDIMRNMNVKVTVHGFRSSFRTWTKEKTDYRTDDCELCLAHWVGSKIVLAYDRGDALERRREIMNAWATHCAGNPAAP